VNRNIDYIPEEIPQTVVSCPYTVSGRYYKIT